MSRRRRFGGLGATASAVVVALASPALAGCGSADGNPPPAEPAPSPRPVDPPAGAVLRLEGEAEGVAVDSIDGVAAVAYRDPDRVELIDAGRLRPLARLPTGGPSRHLAIGRDPRTLLVPVEYEDRLLVADLRPLACAPGCRPRLGPGRSIATGDFPHDAAQAANGTIFVGDEGADAVTVIRGGRVAATLEVPEQPGGVAVAGGVLAVVSVAAREISFFDAASLEPLATLGAGAGPSHVVAGADGRFYVADTGGDAILVYDAAPAGGGEPRLVDRTNVPASPYGLAIDRRRGLLYVTQTARNRVVQLELTNLAPRMTASFPTVRGPNSVGVDERDGRVVVAGRDGGTVQAFDPARAGR